MTDSGASGVAGVDPDGVTHGYAGRGPGGLGLCRCGWAPDPDWPFVGRGRTFAVDAHTAWVCGIAREYDATHYGIEIDPTLLERLAELAAQREAHKRALEEVRALELPLIHEALSQVEHPTTGRTLYGAMPLISAATGYTREHVNTINVRRRAKFD